MTSSTELKWVKISQLQLYDLISTDLNLICKFTTSDGSTVYAHTQELRDFSLDRITEISISVADYHSRYGIFAEAATNRFKTAIDEHISREEKTLAQIEAEQLRGPEALRGPEEPQEKVQLTYDESAEIYSNAYLRDNVRVSLSPTGEPLPALWVNWPHMSQLLGDRTPALYMERDEWREHVYLKGKTIEAEEAIAQMAKNLTVLMDRYSWAVKNSPATQDLILEMIELLAQFVD